MRLLVFFWLFPLLLSAQYDEPEIFAARMDSLFFTDSRGKHPGFSILIVKDGKTVYNRSTGLANVRKEIPVSSETVFALASVSKQFTALGILLLEEEGKLKTTDDVRKYIPELPEYPYPIQIKHLLSHTSGIRDHIMMLDWEDDQKPHYYTFAGTLEALQRFNGLSFAPGEDFAYSNTGYELLAMIIERVSGKKFEQYMQEVIFKPLGMEHSEFSFRRKHEEYNYSCPYNYLEKNKTFRKQKLSEVNAMGATGVYTTLNDFVKWDQNFTNHTVGSENVHEKMNTPGILNSGESVNYNNGLKHRLFKGYKLIEHSGGWAHYNFNYTRIPELNMSVIIGSNNEYDYPIGMNEKILHVLIPENRMDEPKPETDNFTLTAGTYLSSDFTLRRIKLEGKNPIIQGPHLYGAKKYRILDSSTSCFADSVHYSICPDEDLKGFAWSGGSYFNTPKNFRQYVSEIRDYANCSGKYTNPELGKLKIKYKAKSKKLILIRSIAKHIKLEEIEPGLFKAGRAGYSVLFMDSETISLGNDWVFNVLYKK